MSTANAGSLPFWCCQSRVRNQSEHHIIVKDLHILDGSTYCRPFSTPDDRRIENLFLKDFDPDISELHGIPVPGKTQVA